MVPIRYLVEGFVGVSILTGLLAFILWAVEPDPSTLYHLQTPVNPAGGGDDGSPRW